MKQVPALVTLCLTLNLSGVKIFSIKLTSSGQGERYPSQFPIGGDNPRAQFARMIR